jgi:hypothetical protein
MCFNGEINLFCLSDGNSENNIYIYSATDDEDSIRESFEDVDHGGMNFDIWSKVISEGTITKVNSLDEVPEAWHSCLPFCNDDIGDFDLYIEDFFSDIFSDNL